MAVAEASSGGRRSGGEGRGAVGRRVSSQARTNICSHGARHLHPRQARELRVKRRLTIDQIAERMAVFRSTVYHWVRDLPVSDRVRHSSARQRARRKGTRAMQRKYRLLREDAYREGLESFASLATDPSFRDFVCLYIAEGYKRRRHTAEICNSDPAVIQLATRWMRLLTSKTPVFTIQYHADQSLTALRRFWSTALDIEPDAIHAFPGATRGVDGPAT